MKLHTLLIIGVGISLGACTEREQAAPGTEDIAAPAAAEAEPAVPAGDQKGTAAFIEHMHHHASQLGQLQAALEVGSLAAAQRPAYWLAGHEEIGGVPEGWLVYVNGMRDGASAVDGARDLQSARAAAEQIEASCMGCHAAAGVDVALQNMD